MPLLKAVDVEGTLQFIVLKSFLKRLVYPTSRPIIRKNKNTVGRLASNDQDCDQSSFTYDGTWIPCAADCEMG